MKKILFAATLLVLTAACGPKHDGYTIKGTIAGAPDGQIILRNNSKDEPVADTVTITNGKFEFIGKVATPEFYNINVGSKNISLFVDNSPITIDGHIDSLGKAVIKRTSQGDAIQATVDEKDKINKDFETKYPIQELISEYRAQGTTDERKLEIQKIFEIRGAELEAVDSLFMAQNPHSPYTVALVQRSAYYMDFAKLASFVADFTSAPELAGNRLVGELQKTVAALETVQVGKKAPDFTQNDPNGKPITLSDVYSKNKITMIDFWASWCGPCRNFNPTLVKIYKKYHPKGFEILAVSFDRPDGKEKWLKAIKDDNLTWLHVSDLKFWSNEAGQLYSIRGIPANVFIDQNGIIISLRMDEKEEIEKFLDERL